ncbi:TIGR01777 family oxidoreductase [Aureisphaera galaxeae]|uniref:TIGR01777 family oxidoreductase n=1 Tax=Aureisphaera galaxeae TaxID=1538023 RepID=UPI00235031E4|nr:TIGR01777 family oxidoreductase [Aureisphaera galaxeae]MDC8005618.1 TIGR01777 family oxidoreductase [Aureisphaera galaxeae]
MRKLIIAGGSGFLGSILINHFKNKVHSIIVLSRTKTKTTGNITYVKWDGQTLGDWVKHLEHADVLINLTGKSVDCRYHEKNKERILFSRVDSTRVLGQGIELSENPPKIWINSSTATIYEDSRDKEMDEENGIIGTGFSVNVATSWEKEFFQFQNPQLRQIALRTSIVFGRKGGAFVPLKNLSKVGFGGKQGDGQQKVSWIHEEDFARSVEYIIRNEDIKGVINIVSPSPTTNMDLMKMIRKGLKMPFGIPMSKLLLEMGARVIKTETELILKSRNVIPKRLMEHGFTFKYPSLEKTILHLLKS